ncbi:MAG TPA: hypothetical protein VJ179_03850, partial [Patescibacteria group bacterium]|nr:hypothetical protein [Patescibacteria group bacterium]
GPDVWRNFLADGRAVQKSWRTIMNVPIGAFFPILYSSGSGSFEFVSSFVLTDAGSQYVFLF